MNKTGKVLSCVSDNYNYTIDTNQGQKTLHRFTVVIQTPTEVLTGKYDSPDLTKPSFVVGEDIPFEIEQKVMKNGTTYLKFKKAKKDSPYNDSPETRAQIERNVSMHCALTMHRNNVGLDVARFDLTSMVYAWIRNNAVENGDTRQSSITAQGAIKLVVEFLPELEITNIDMFWNKLDKIANYIING